MLSCKDVAMMMSSGDSASFMKRLELRLHLMMCTHCSWYAMHLKMLNQGFRRLFEEKTKVDPAEVSKLENEIIKNIQGKK